MHRKVTHANFSLPYLQDRGLLRSARNFASEVLFHLVLSEYANQSHSDFCDVALLFCRFEESLEETSDIHFERTVNR